MHPLASTPISHPAPAHHPRRTLTRLALTVASAIALAAPGSQAAAQTRTPQAPNVSAPITPTLTLGDALDRADRHAYANRAMRANAQAKHGEAMAPLRGILPSVRLESGYIRTTDPIGAFGTTLRQRAITQQDFDPSRLNFPAATPNYSGGMVLEQPIFNADAWIGRRAATRMANAADDDASWKRDDTRLDVIRAYFGAILASEKATTLAAAQRAAREHVRQAELMAKNGIVTPSDALLASVKAGEVDAQLLQSLGDAATARHGLATAIGTPVDTIDTLPQGLPNAEAARSVAEKALGASIVEVRADVRSAERTRQAADDDATRARSLYLPRVNGFARYDWNSVARPYGGEKNWTVGVMASWSPFAGASEIAEGRTTLSRLDAATAMAQGAAAKANLEVAQATIALGSALARLDVTARGVQQAIDAHRIVTRRYAGGLASVVELLDAAAIETSSRLVFAAARYDLIVAAATRLHALGLDPGAVRALDDAPRASVASPVP